MSERWRPCDGRLNTYKHRSVFDDISKCVVLHCRLSASAQARPFVPAASQRGRGLPQSLVAITHTTVHPDHCVKEQ